MSEKTVTLPMQSIKPIIEKLRPLLTPLTAEERLALIQAIVTLEPLPEAVYQYQPQSVAEVTSHSASLRPLLGLWQDFTITDDDLTLARQEMWGNFGERGL